MLADVVRGVDAAEDELAAGVQASSSGEVEVTVTAGEETLVELDLPG